MLGGTQLAGSHRGECSPEAGADPVRPGQRGEQVAGGRAADPGGLGLGGKVVVRFTPPLAILARLVQSMCPEVAGFLFCFLHKCFKAMRAYCRKIRKFTQEEKKNTSSTKTVRTILTFFLYMYAHMYNV